jgi:DNA primase
LKKYSQEIVAEVIAATDIVDLVGASVELKPSGSARYLGLCPFHQEKTPSFSVSRDRQRFYCFGCEKGGDAISFLCEHDGLSFVESLRTLADKAGIRLPALTERDNKEDYLRSQLLELNGFAAKFFRGVLADPIKGGRGRAYLNTRKLTDATIRQFGVGYAPDTWNALTDAAREAGYKDDVIQASGLAKRSDKGGLYDFFRNRLMFPIRDASANVVAFGGRDLSGDAPGKYINTPENVIYKKGRTLYGLYEAREAIRHEKSALLVEGYFDLLRCFDSGVKTALAPCGTALTSEQATLIRRYAPEAVEVFDGDAAGVRAALRGVAILTGAGLRVRALLLPENQDPDDYVLEHGGEAFRELLANASDFVSFYVRMNEGRIKSIEGRTDVARELFTILQGVDDVLRREEYLKEAAHELRLDRHQVRAEFDRFLRNQSRRQKAPAEPAPARQRNVKREDCDFCAALMRVPALRETVREGLASVTLPAGPLADVVEALLSEQVEGAGGDLEREESSQLYAAAANSLLAEEGPDKTEEKAREVVSKRLASLKREVLVAEADGVMEAIREAERREDTSQLMELLNKKVRIDRALQQVGVF